jgi:S1-C subfamily serine protease
MLRSHWVITNRHVVENDVTGELREPISVSFADRPRMSATLAHVHPTIDVAVIRIQFRCRCCPLLAASDEETPLSASLWFGFCPSRSDLSAGRRTGVVRAVRNPTFEDRERDDGVDRVLRFEAPGWEPGNSGGAVFDGVGRVVAVVFAGVPDGVVQATGIHRVRSWLNLLPSWRSA